MADSRHWRKLRMQRHSLNRIRASGLRCKAYPDVDQVGQVLWRFPKRVMVLRHVYLVHRPHCPPDPALLASGQPVPSPDPSTGFVCSLEINRNSQVRHSKHPAGYQASGGRSCPIQFSTSPRGCPEGRFGRRGESTCLHTPSPPVSAYLGIMNPVLF